MRNPHESSWRVCPGVKVVEAADDDVGRLESLKRVWLRKALGDRSASRAHADPAHDPAHDGRLLPAEPDVEPSEAEEAVAIGWRGLIGIDEDDLAHAKMRELMTRC
jgi:hypothetical protein